MASVESLNTVQDLYIAYYQRPGDPSGLLYWADRLDTGTSLSELEAAFGSSPESQALYGPINNDTIGDVIDAIYLSLFDRLPDAAGKAFYTAGFIAGTFTPASIAYNILIGATGSDAVAINNKQIVADRFSESVDGRPFSDPNFGQGTQFAATYAGEADAVAARTWLGDVTSEPTTIQSEAQTVDFIQTNIANPGDPILNAGGKTFTLTTSQDVLTGTGGPDTFNGFTVAPNDTQTLNNSDRLDGKAGNDTLNATLNGGTTSPTLASVEQINVQALANSTLNLLNVTGATNLVDNNSGGYLTVNNAGALADYGISNTKQGMTVNDLTAKTITVAATNAGTTGTAAPVTSNVGLNTTPATGGLTKVTATVENSHIFIDAGSAGAGKGMTELDIVSNGTANEVGHWNNGNVKTVVVTGAAKLDLTVNSSNLLLPPH